jgi:methionine-rich copper-binding protein CopC
MVLISDRQLRNAAWALGAIVVAALIVPTAVLAHAELETATPANKSTVTEPVAEISGIYSEAMKPEGSSLVVKDASGTQVAKGGVDPANDLRMVATPASPLGNGTFTVESTTLAEDGDIEHATWTFTVAIAATTTPSAAASAASSAAPTSVPATPVATVAPAPSPSGDGSTTGSGGDVILPIIVALVALGAGAAYLLTRRNRPTDQT